MVYKVHCKLKPLNDVIEISGLQIVI
jgi:hypothetical protein